MQNNQFEQLPDSIETELKREHLTNQTQNRGLRLKYSTKIFYLSISYLLYVGIVLLFNKQLFNISDSVLITLLGSTTATVISLFIIVAKYIFPTNGN